MKEIILKNLSSVDQEKSKKRRSRPRHRQRKRQVLGSIFFYKFPPLSVG